MYKKNNIVDIKIKFITSFEDSCKSEWNLEVHDFDDNIFYYSIPKSNRNKLKSKIKHGQIKLNDYIGEKFRAKIKSVNHVGSYQVKWPHLKIT